MTNVIALRPQVTQDPKATATALIAGVASGRRLTDDVFWLKENAELLGVLSATKATVEPAALEVYAGIYDQMLARMTFFPQYYRFLLSLALDLEDLGLGGDTGTGAALCAWVAREGLAEAELSDLQRAEARRLLARRGLSGPKDDALNARLHGFISRPKTFAVPNKKAAYELTHIVFYLSEYGARDPRISAAAKRSLTYAGLLAFLDQNMDLLAEVCTALRFAKAPVPQVWCNAVCAAHRQIVAAPTGQGDLNDAFHEYLVTGWMAKVFDAPAFQAEIPQAPLRFVRPAPAQGALRSLSECLYEMGPTRSSTWHQMRPHVLPRLGPKGHEVLLRAEAATDQFEPFFESFARAAQG